MLEKKIVLDQIEVKSDGVIFVKEHIQILDNGVVINSIPHRTAITPDMEIPEELTKYSELNNISEIIRTNEVVQAYKQKAEELENSRVEKRLITS